MCLAGTGSGLRWRRNLRARRRPTIKSKKNDARSLRTSLSLFLAGRFVTDCCGPPYVCNVETKLFFHLFFLRFAALQHLDFRDVNGALVGIDIGFHLYMVAVMVLECLRIVDSPGLLVLVCNEGDFVAVYLDRAVDTLQRSLGSLIFLRRLLGWILRKRGHAKDDSERENDHKQRFHGSTSLNELFDGASSLD